MDTMEKASGRKEWASVSDFAKRVQESIGFNAWRPLVIVARATLEARGEVGMCSHSWVMGTNFPFLLIFFLFQKGSLQ